MNILAVVRVAIFSILLATSLKLEAQVYVFKGAVTELVAPTTYTYYNEWSVGTPVVFTLKLFSPLCGWSDGAANTMFEYLTIQDDLVIGNQLCQGAQMPMAFRYNFEGFYGLHIGYYGFYTTNNDRYVHPVYLFGSKVNEVNYSNGLLKAGLPISAFEENDSIVYVTDDDSAYVRFSFSSYSVDGVWSPEVPAVPEAGTMLSGALFFLGASFVFFRRFRRTANQR